jgi:hypothetical protein
MPNFVHNSSFDLQIKNIMLLFFGAGPFFGQRCLKISPITPQAVLRIRTLLIGSWYFFYIYITVFPGIHVIHFFVS